MKGSETGEQKRERESQREGARLYRVRIGDTVASARGE